MQDACDEDWASYERNYVQKLYDRQHYDIAYRQLSFYLNKCKSHLSPETNMWMQNDLALSALKNNDPTQCKSILTEIAKNSRYATAPETLKKSMTQNILAYASKQ